MHKVWLFCLEKRRAGVNKSVVKNWLATFVKYVVL